MNSFPILPLLLVAPLAGAALVWLSPRRETARVLALAASLATLVLTLLALAAFDPAQPGFQLVARHDWIPSIGVRYHVGVDGISLPFLPLAALLFGSVLLASWNAVHVLPRLYYSLLLLLEAATLGVFCALDTMLFFLCWELTLPPLYFLVSLWGLGPERRHAAAKYTLVMLAGGVPLLFGFLLLAFAGGGAPVFDLPALLAMPLPRHVEYAVFLLLLAGFGAKLPLFPLHTWLPLLAMEGPAGVAALVTGLKLGAYGLIRFAVPLAPGAAQDLHWLLAGFGVVAMLYGAAVALAQTNLRRMLAYASLSHVGLVVLGVASFNAQGLQGAIFQLLVFPLAAGGLFLLAGALHQRTGSTDVADLGGVAQGMPRLAGFFLLFGLAGMGLPGTAGFPGELLILVSSFERHAGAGMAALATMVLGAAYFLGVYRQAFFGHVLRAEVRQAVDLKPREFWPALVFAALLLLFGLFPGSLLELLRPAAAAWVARL